VLKTRPRCWDGRYVTSLRASEPRWALRKSGRQKIARSVRVPDGRHEEHESYTTALRSSVRRFLGKHAIHSSNWTVSEDNITGIDWASSHTSTPFNVEGITVPLLISQHTGHYFIVIGEIIYEHAKSADKEIVFIYGANHGGSACTPCQVYHGLPPFGDTQKVEWDYIHTWLTTRYP
jgi:hypothetical protein